MEAEGVVQQPPKKRAPIDFSNLDEQIERLKQKNLIIDDEQTAKKTLVKASYYSLINGYKAPFLAQQEEYPKQKERFSDNVHFEDVHNLYKFDAKLRQIILSISLAIEEDLASIIAHIIGDTYCNGPEKRTHGKPLSYLCRESLNVSKEKEGELHNLFRDVDYALTNPNMTPVKYHMEQYGYVPPWVLVKSLSFGNFISWYNLSEVTIKKRIIGTFLRIDPEKIDNDDKKIVQVYYALKIIQLFRNAAAHGGRIYNFQTDNVYFPYMRKYHGQLLGISKSDYNNKGVGKSDFLAFILAIFYLNAPEGADDNYEKEYKNECVEEFMDDLKEVFGHYIMNNIKWVGPVLETMNFKIEYLNLLERSELK